MSEYFEPEPGRFHPEIEKSYIPDVLLIMGTSVKPQLRGKPGERHVVISGMYDDEFSQYDALILRTRIMAAKELVSRGFVNGPVVPSGTRTVNKERLNQDVYEMSWDMAHAENELRDNGIPSPTDEEVMDKLRHVYHYLDPTSQHEFLGRPMGEKEKQLVEETTEAMMIGKLLREVKPKFDGEQRTEMNIEIIEENNAKNSIENIIYTLNLLDNNVGKKFDGTISILTSNNGHLERAELILLMFGIEPEQMLLLDPEEILRYFGYDERFLRRIEDWYSKEETLRQCTLWMEGLRVLPDYVLPELALFENNDRLISSLSSLRAWYKRTIDMDICTLHPELLQFESMDPKKLRGILRSIPRQMPPPEWKDRWDIEKMKEHIALYKQATRTWLESSSTQ